MMSKMLIREYLDLYREYNGSSFTLREASVLVRKSPKIMRYDIHKIKDNMGLISLGRANYRLIDPVKWMGLVSSLGKFPELEPFYKEILPHLDKIDALFLTGSRARGDYFEDSDYDFIAFVDSQEAKEVLKLSSEKFKLIQIEAFETSKIEKQLELDPLYMISSLREAEPIFGNSLRRLFLSYEIDRIALLTDLKEGIERLETVRNFIVGEVDEETISTAIYISFLRWRQAYLIKSIIEDFEPKFLEEFSNYYPDKKRLNELYRFYRVVRDLGEGQSPKKVPEISNEELLKLIDVVKDYVNKIFKQLEMKAIEDGGAEGA